MYGINTLPNYYSYSNGGYVPRQPYGLGSLVKGITRPIAKVLDKVVPNEVKPFLPYVAAIAPFTGIFGSLAGSMPGFGLTGPALEFAQRGLLGGALNAVSQLSQEGAEKRGLSPLSTLMSVGTAGLSGGTAGQFLEGFRPVFGDMDLTAPGFLDTAKSSAINALQSSSEFLNKGREAPLFSMDFAKAASVPVVGAATEQAYNVAQNALDKYNAEQNALGQMGVADQSKRKAAVIHAMQLAGFDQTGIDSALGRLGLADGGIGYQYGGGTIGYANGGRAAYGLGGDVLKALGELSSNIKYGGGFKKGIARTYENVKKPILDRIARFGDDIDIKIADYDYAEDAGVSYNIIVKPKTKKGETIMNKLAEENPYDRKNFREGIEKYGDRYYLPQGEFATHYLDDALSRGAKASGVTTDLGEFYRTKDMLPNLSQNPYINELSHGEQDVYEALSKYQKKADGGLMSLGGREMDFRDGGGFVPIGAKERADDVPARLSKNEFVFTAKAVRNAGDGDIKEGARRMYQIMKNLEARG